MLVVQQLRAAYAFDAYARSWLASAFDFVQLFGFVLCVTIVHVATALVVLLRYPLFVSYIERRRRRSAGAQAHDERDDAEAPRERHAPPPRPLRETLARGAADALAALRRPAPPPPQLQPASPSSPLPPTPRTPRVPLDSPSAPRRVSWAQRAQTFFSPPAGDKAHDERAPPPIRISQPYHPRSPRVTRSSVV